MIRALFIAGAILFCCKIAWNLGIPYVLAVRTLRQCDQTSKGISMIPGVELTLLVLLVVLALVGAAPWPHGALRVAALGGLIIAGSYLHLVLAGAAVGAIVSSVNRHRRQRNRH